MQYKIMSRKTCERYSAQKHKETAVIISIKSTWDHVAPQIEKTIENNIKDILFLSFDDLDYDICAQYGTFDGLMTKKDAKAVYQFCQKWYGKVDRFIFHCDAGVSRSAGCCGAIMRWFEGFDHQIMHKKTKYPNMYCYNLVLDACRGIECAFVSSP